jgi:phospholipase C
MRWELGLGCLIAALLPAGAGAAPAPRTPIGHVITVMQENHSFDNYFGTYPGADGVPANACMPRDPANPRRGCVAPFHIDNRPVEDLSDTPQVAAAQRDGGAMDGFLSAIAQQRGRQQPLVMGHYDKRELPFYWRLADEYVLFDRFFGSAAGGSLTNHMFWATGGPGDQDGRESVPAGGFTTPTIFDRLEEKGVSWKFYVQDYDPAITFRSRRRRDRAGQVRSVPLLNYARFVDDPKLFSHIVPMEQFQEDLQRGTLPAVSYVVPLGARERPPGSLKLGQLAVGTLLNGLMRSRYWPSSAFLLTYDSSGGWYDHVRPPRVDRWGYGFRVPALLVSPYAKRGDVDHTTLDFTSILQFIERNWGLQPLTGRDRRARGSGLMGAFAFDRGPRPAEFLTGSPDAGPAADPATTPVLVTYGAALGGALLVIGLALLHEVVLRRRAPRLRGASWRVRVGQPGDP